MVPKSIRFHATQSTWELPKPCQFNTRIYPFRDIVFVDHKLGWLTIGNILFKTEDAGRTWSYIDSGKGNFAIESFFPYGSSHCWLCCWETSACPKPRIPVYKTADGGETWTLPWAGRPSVRYSSRRISYFTSHNIGWLATTELSRKNGKVILFHTEDGGKAWREIKTDLPYEPAFMRFQNGTEGWMLAHGPEQDPRRSWQVVGTVEGKQEAFLIGGYTYVFLRTADGGRTWRERRFFKRDIYAAYTFDAENIIVVGEGGGIFRSLDGGETWASSRSRTRQDLEGVDFLDRRTGIAVGYNGTIVYTENGGVDWEKIVSRQRSHFHRVHLLDSRSGIIAELNGLYFFELE